MTKRALVADDDNLSREFLAEALRAAGYAVDEAASGNVAIDLFRASVYDLVLTDLRMPGGDGLHVLEKIRALNAEVPVILVTAYGDVDTTIQAMRQGAQDFIVKPVSIEQIDLFLGRLAERNELVRKNRVLEARISDDTLADDDIVGNNPRWLACQAMAERIANTKATVLVRGESGSGKEVIASLLHSKSSRADGPFIKTNCAVLQDSLLTSELFGHEKGAFTNAYTKKEGRFELADGGTLFLDEIGEISPEIQAKLLRVIETGRFERVGGKETLEVDVRIVCATNRDLEAMMRNGDFRDDLFYRLNVVPLEVPPLRQRGDDVVDLALHFLERYAREYKSPARRLSPDAERRLRSYNWPGNVRELANLMQRSALLAGGEEIGESMLALEARDAIRGGASLVGLSIADVERKLILDTLELTRNNKTEAARILGVTSRTLANKLRLYREQGHLPMNRAVAR